MRLLLDANVVIAYLGSKRSEQTAVHAILVAADSAKLTLLHVDWAIAEINRVARERRPIARRVSDERLNAVTAWIAAVAAPTFMPAPPYRIVCRDPNDDAIVAAAIANGAEVVVTLDRDLLALGEYAGVLFVKPGAALALLRAEGVIDPNAS